MTKIRSILPHLVAGILALTYAWLVSGTRFVTTGVQFVAPLAVILLAHLAWLGASRNLEAGFSLIVIRRSLATAIGICGFTALLAAIAPLPAEASPDLPEILGTILGVLACLATMAIVVGVTAGAVYIEWIAISRLLGIIFKRPPGAGENRLYDLGAVAVAMFAIGLASLEGVPGAYDFAPGEHASSSYAMSASPERAWKAIGKATSPAFPLPMIFRSIPRPVAVLVDEGTDLGSRRIVRFAGRQGVGDLVLQVVRRSPEEAVFEAVSDASPISHWVHHKALTFRVEPDGTGSRLTVALDYNRLFSPAWFFGPYIRFAAFLAVDVLARDTKARAEQL